MIPLAPLCVPELVACPMWPWFYSPFKGEKDGLLRYKTHWNFIQYNIRVLVERTFGMLKGRFRILLKRVDIPLSHMLNLVTICIYLHNMCIANSNGFDMDLALEVKKDAQIEANKTFGNLKGIDIFWVAEKTIKQMKRSQNARTVDINDRNDMEDMVDMEHQGEDEDHVLTTMKNNPNRKAKEEKIKKVLIETMATHEALQKTTSLNQI